MADFKAIMTLAVAGHSYDEIVAVAGCSRRDVSTAKKTIAAYGFTAGQIGAMSPEEIARLFPDGRKRVTEAYERPDFDRVLASTNSMSQDWGHRTRIFPASLTPTMAGAPVSGIRTASGDSGGRLESI